MLAWRHLDCYFCWWLYQKRRASLLKKLKAFLPFRCLVAVPARGQIQIRHWATVAPFSTYIFEVWIQETVKIVTILGKILENGQLFFRYNPSYLVTTVSYFSDFVLSCPVYVFSFYLAQMTDIMYTSVVLSLYSANQIPDHLFYERSFSFIEIQQPLVFSGMRGRPLYCYSKPSWRFSTVLVQCYRQHLSAVNISYWLYMVHCLQ